jgi:hypothetical protein
MEIATEQSKLMGTTVSEAFNRITTAIFAQSEKGPRPPAFIST